MTVDFDNVPVEALSQDCCPALAAHRLSLRAPGPALLTRVSSQTCPETSGSLSGHNSSPNKGG